VDGEGRYDERASGGEGSMIGMIGMMEMVTRDENMRWL
jgi:hypothetical protein